MTAADPSRDLERIRWRSRRGLLELDLVLERFLAAHLATLDDAQRAQYDQLLTLPDNELLDLVMGRKSPADARLHPLLSLIVAA